MDNTLRAQTPEPEDHITHDFLKPEVPAKKRKRPGDEQEPGQPSSTGDIPPTADTPQPKKAKLEESWPARHKQFVESRMAEHKKIETELDTLAISAANYDESISTYIQLAREKSAAKVREIEDRLEAQHAKFEEDINTIVSRDEEAYNTFSSPCKDSSSTNEEEELGNIENASKVIIWCFKEQIELYKQYIQAQKAQLTELEKIINQTDSKDSEPSSSTEASSSKAEGTKKRKGSDDEQKLGQPSSTGDTPQLKKAKLELEESWPARRTQLVKRRAAELKNTETKLDKLAALAKDYDGRISTYIGVARGKLAAIVREIEDRRAAQYAELMEHIKTINSRGKEAHDTIVRVCKDSSSTNKEEGLENIENAFNIIAGCFNEKIELYKQYIQAQKDDDANSLKRLREERIKTALESFSLEDDAPSIENTKREDTEYNIAKRKFAFDKLVEESLQAANEAAKKLKKKITSKKKLDQDFLNLLDLLAKEIPGSGLGREDNPDSQEHVKLGQSGNSEAALEPSNPPQQTHYPEEIATIQQSMKKASQNFQENLKKHTNEKEFDETKDIMVSYTRESYPKTIDGFNTFDDIVRYLSQEILKHFEKQMSLYEQYSKEQIKHITDLRTILDAHRRYEDYASWKTPGSPGEEEMEDIGKQAE